MQSTPSLETFFSRIFHHYPNLHLALCTSHHWMDIRKVCYLSVSWYTLLHLPEMPKTSCPQISSSNTTSFLLPSIHSFSLFLGQEPPSVPCVGISLHFSISLPCPSHHDTLPTTIPSLSSLSNPQPYPYFPF